MASTLPEPLLQQLSDFVARHLGLSFPAQRWPELERGLRSAAAESGAADVESWARQLAAAPPVRERLELLAGNLTIGETYFFRDKKVFETLARDILPPLIQARRGRDQHLRLWSAACCTGEEAYSLAILLRQMLPDLAEWNITLLATDINPHFLRKAAIGSYGPWSFRDAPPGFQDIYFHPAQKGRFQIAPEIQRMVRFASLNLATDNFPSLESETNAMDVIFCRNVLMYFTPIQLRKVVGKLHHSLVDGGWLAVSPSEVSQELFPQFVIRHFPGVIFFQKDDHMTHRKAPPWEFPVQEPPPFVAPVFTPPPAWSLPTPIFTPPAPEPPPPPPPQEVTARVKARALQAEGLYGEAAAVLIAAQETQPLASEDFSLLARALANQGQLADSLIWCDRWIAADKIDAAGHYLRATILSEQGLAEQARPSFQRALYLQPDFVLAHFALGNLARNLNRFEEAGKHFANALDLLKRHRPDDLLPESDGLTAGRLTETITAMISAVRHS